MKRLISWLIEDSEGSRLFVIGAILFGCFMVVHTVSEGQQVIPAMAAVLGCFLLLVEIVFVVLTARQGSVVGLYLVIVFPVVLLRLLLRNIIPALQQLSFLDAVATLSSPRPIDIPISTLSVAVLVITLVVASVILSKFTKCNRILLYLFALPVSIDVLLWFASADYSCGVVPVLSQFTETASMLFGHLNLVYGSIYLILLLLLVIHVLNPKKRSWRYRDQWFDVRFWPWYAVVSLTLTI